MKELKMTGRFKKDLKRIQNNPKRVAKVKAVLRELKETGMLSPGYKPHHLVGDYAGYWECHIESDYLLIWVDETEQVIKLIRLGTHSELF